MAASLSVTREGGSGAPDQLFMVYATRGVSAGVNFVSESEYRFVSYYDGDEGNPVDVTPAYVAKFGSLRAGTKIFLRCFQMNSVGAPGSGLTSDPLEVSVIVS